MQGKNKPPHEQLETWTQVIDGICDQLCKAVDGVLDFVPAQQDADATMQKLTMLINFVIDAARRALEDVEKQNKQLKDLDRIKSNFVASISHELRTPLTLILGPLEEVLSHRDQIPNEQALQLERCHRNACRLLLLVNDLLDFSKTEAGQMKANLEPTDLESILQNIVQDAQDAAKAKKVHLSYQQISNIGYIKTDIYLIERILLNLISNALKFTPEGGEIVISSENSGDMLTISIRDTGAGIAEEQLPKLFQRFQQGDMSSTKRHGGTGLGLALVKEFCTILGGDIFVKSEIGKGSEFTIRLPLHQCAPPSQPHKRSNFTRTLSNIVDPSSKFNVTPKSNDSAQHQDTILVVDDTADMRSYMVGILSKTYNILEAEDGIKAFELLTQNSVKVIVSDVMMPQMDGFELTKLIKSTPELAMIPVILVTARGGSEEVSVGLSQGADDYLVKPFSSIELEARVDAARRMYDLHQKLRTNSWFAGQFDFRAGILHNAGNVLNSVSISGEIIEEKIKKLQAKTLKDCSNMLNKAPEELAAFLANDPKGQKIPRFLDMFADHLDSQQSVLLGEIATLRKKLEHLSRVVHMGEDATKIVEREEFIKLEDVIRAVVEIEQFACEELKIEIITNIKQSNSMVIDRHKVTQILLNLLSNARHALRSVERQNKQIMVTVEASPHETIIAIEDNGIGIPPENLAHLFEAGFTTRKDGSGIGLHMSALMAKELGGKIEVESEGSEGAKFRLRLPIRSLHPVVPVRINKKQV